MSDEEGYVSYGTPLEPLEEDEVPKKRPLRVEDQVVTDDKGRRRFHGAFTGGFSAGYFNTVGTKEGWTPTAFISSRSGKAGFKPQTALDIMDEEDKGEHGISHQAVHVTSNYQVKSENLGKRAGETYHRSGPIPGEPPLSNLIKPSRETIGFQLLKFMGWKSGQGIGPRLKFKDKRKQLKQIDSSTRVYGCAKPDDISTDDEDGNLKDHTFAPVDIDCLPYTAKDDNFGLGYERLKKDDYLQTHINLFEPTSTKAVLKDKSRLAISGQAFGVGAFEDDDEDIYARDDMTRYDFELGSAEKQKPLKKKPSKSLNEALDGFHISSKSKVELKLYTPPLIPKDFKPIHKDEKSNKIEQKTSSLKGMDRHSLSISERSHMIEEKSTSSSVFDLISPQERAKLELASKLASTPTQGLPPQEKANVELASKFTSTPTQSMTPQEKAKLELAIKFISTPTQGMPSQEKAKLELASKFISTLAQDMPPQEKAKMELASKFSYASTKGMPSQEKSHVESDYGILQEIHSKNKSDFKPFKSDVKKQARYEQFLELLKVEQTDRISLLQPSSMTEWEKEREQDEFIRAASLYRPLNGPMSSRFTSAKYQDNEATVEVSIDEVADRSDEMKAAQMKMFGKMTRKKFEWHPHKLLCKRFNIPNPYPGCELVGLPVVQKEKYSLFNFLSVPDADKKSIAEKDDPIDVEKEFTPASSLKKAKTFDSSNSKTLVVETNSKTISNTNSESPKEEIEERPSVDFFKAIFAIDESSSEDETDISDDDSAPIVLKNSPEMSDSLSVKKPELMNSEVDIKSDFVKEGGTKVATGVFTDIDFEKLNSVPKNNNEPYKSRLEKEKSIETVTLDQDIKYGPALPPTDSIKHHKHSKKKKKKEKSKKNKHKDKKNHKVKKSKHKRVVVTESDSSSSDSSEDNHKSRKEKNRRITNRLRKISSSTLKRFL